MQCKLTADKINGGSKEQDEVTGEGQGRQQKTKSKEQSRSRQAENDQSSGYTVLSQ